MEVVVAHLAPTGELPLLNWQPAVQQVGMPDQGLPLPGQKALRRKTTLLDLLAPKRLEQPLRMGLSRNLLRREPLALWRRP